MTRDTIQPPMRPAPRNGFGKRVKTASIAVLVASLFWIVFMVFYWPRLGDLGSGNVTLRQGGPAPIAIKGSTGAVGVASAQPQSQAEDTAVNEAASSAALRDGLRLPVQGVAASALIDSYAEARGDGTREHNAIDIMAPRGTPVIAATAGTIEKLFLSKAGGTTLYERSSNGKVIYYYAHLDSYAPGISEGMTITPGETLGFVGSTGDADPGAPHLHFAIMALAPGEHWWQGRPINPYPLLGGR